jgi:glutaredoxin
MRRAGSGVRRTAIVCVAVLAAALLAVANPPAASAEEHAVITYFWGDGCPHCAAEKAFLDELVERDGRIRVDAYEVWYDAAGRQRLEETAKAMSFTVSGVPVTVVGDRHWVGFSAAIAQEIEDAVLALLAPAEQMVGPPAIPEPEVIEVPLLGEVTAGQGSLALSTAAIAFVDGFNPCSLWVLTVLLALVLRSGSRRRVVLVGATFLVVTAAVYGLFIVGVFSVLSYVGFLPWIRAAVVVAALTFGLVNVKDYFLFKQGPSFTIAESRKAGIFSGARRVRTALSTEASTLAVVGVTAGMALGVSLVELACTAGFPVIWSATLAAHDVGAGLFAGLLALYLGIYLLDEAVIFGAAVVTLRATRMQEQHGRQLKLVAGMVMLALAGVMAIEPALMSSITASVLVFASALGGAAVVMLVHGVWRRRRRPPSGTELAPEHTSRRLSAQPSKKSDMTAKGRVRASR